MHIHGGASPESARWVGSLEIQRRKSKGDVLADFLLARSVFILLNPSTQGPPI